MTQAQAKALARMHAANAALTPEQRKARSEKAAAAAKARKVGAAQAGNGGSEKATSTTAARVQPEVLRSFDVCLSTDAGRVWVAVQAGGIKRAMGAARDANPGSKALGAVLAGVLPAGVLGR